MDYLHFCHRFMGFMLALAGGFVKSFFGPAGPLTLTPVPCTDFIRPRWEDETASDPQAPAA